MGRDNRALPVLANSVVFSKGLCKEKKTRQAIGVNGGGGKAKPSARVPVLGGALEGPHAYGTSHAKLPPKAALTAHAARRLIMRAQAHAH